MNDEIFMRKRSVAIVDKKRSILNYEKLANGNPQKTNFLNRLSISGLKNNEIENLKNLAFKEDYARKQENGGGLPTPPTGLSNKEKENVEIKFHKKAYITQDFDDVEIIDGQYSLININSLLSKFKEDEIKHLQQSDIYTFEEKEYDKAYKKIDEMKRIAKNNKDTDLCEFFRSKKRAIEREKEKIKVVQNHFDKIEDFIIFKDSMKFFFNETALNSK